MDILTFTFGILGLVGTIGTFYFGIKLKSHERQRYRFSWEDIAKGCRELARKCIRQFKPHSVLTFSGPGSVIANLVLLESRKFLPLYTVIEIKKERSGSLPEILGYSKIETHKWALYLPDALRAITDNKLAVIHDCSVSGDGLALIRRTLLEFGFKPENLKIAVLVCSQTSIEAKKAPDVYAYCVEHATFFFPWGEKV